MTTEVDSQLSTLVRLYDNLISHFEKDKNFKGKTLDEVEEFVNKLIRKGWMNKIDYGRIYTEEKNEIGCIIGIVKHGELNIPELYVPYYNLRLYNYNNLNIVEGEPEFLPNTVSKYPIRVPIEFIHRAIERNKETKSLSDDLYRYIKNHLDKLYKDE